ncbi:MAG: 2-oxoacid:acceptor oxidoreductase subunit alpha [Thermoplasmata archaeon]|nr:2-oxoacid:acceptor oxidoreductase subunit alpha [Thermoplasmata archaeon]
MREFLLGNEACVRGAIHAGCRFYAGYPITPSTEIAEAMARELPKAGGTFIQMEDEIASISACIGASWTGLKVMSATSGPGFSLMQEGIGYAAMTETPIVIVNCMRGGPSTGQPTKPAQGDVIQAKHGSHGDYEIIALSPSSVQEMLDLTVEAFNLAEQYRTPVILLADGEIAHMREPVTINEGMHILQRKMAKPGIIKEVWKPEDDGIVPFPVFGRGHRVYISGTTSDIYGYPSTIKPEVHAAVVRRICDKIRKNAQKIWKYEVFKPEARKIIFAYGLPARTAFAVAKGNTDVGVFRPITLWPFPDGPFADTVRGREVYVLEMNYGKMIAEVERVAYKAGAKKVEFLPKLGGEIHSIEEVEKFVGVG